jgi:YVTN family beta-propeller protein
MRRCFLFVLVALVSASGPSQAAPAHAVMVTAEAAGKVLFVNPDTGQPAGEIAVGGRPRGLALSRDGRSLFVAVAAPVSGVSGATASGPAWGDAGSGPGLAVLDVRARKLDRKLPAGPSPASVALSPDGAVAFVTNDGSNEVVRIDLASGAVTAKGSVGAWPKGVAVRPDGKIVYVASHDADEIYALDASTLKLVLRSDAGARPQAVLFSRRGDVAFVPDEGFATVSVIDAQTHAMKHTIGLTLPTPTPTPPTPPGLQGAALSPDGKRLYVTAGASSAVIVIDVGKQAAIGRIDGIGGFARAVTVSGNGRKLYVGNTGSNDLAVVNVASAKVERRIKLGAPPWAVAVAP